MSEFRRWISYIYLYNQGEKGKNTGFAKVDVRNGRCRLHIGVKGVYNCDGKGLEVGIYSRRDGRPVRSLIGRMRIQGGCGEFSGITAEGNLFDTGVSLEDSGGLWLTGSDEEAFYLAFWEGEEDGTDFLERKPEPKKEPEIQLKAAEMEQSDEEEVLEKPEPELDNLPRPGLWESLCRYYPKTGQRLRERGIELLQIRPADIRYLPRQLWHYGGNSFLLHGYYHYHHLVLGRMTGRNGPEYILGVRGIKNEREKFSAGLFGFDSFLEADGKGREGYWYTIITLDS